MRVVHWEGKQSIALAATATAKTQLIRATSRICESGSGPLKPLRQRTERARGSGKNGQHRRVGPARAGCTTKYLTQPSSKLAILFRCCQTRQDVAVDPHPFTWGKTG